MADQRRAEGRGRSRARGVLPPATAIRPGEQRAAPGPGRAGRGVARGAPAPVQPPAAMLAAPAPTASAWGTKPAATTAPPAQQPTSTVMSAAISMQGGSSGGVTEAGAALAKMSVQSGGGGGEGYRSARGATVRGKRGVEVQVRTRPPALNVKQGSSGTMVKLLANYFPIISTLKWVINHYHVDFRPEIDNRRQRFELFKVQRHLFGKHLFDGSAIYTMERLPTNEVELFSVRESDGERIKIDVKFIREIPPNDPVVLQVLGIQMKKNLRHLEMVQVRDLYYDPHDSKQIPEYGLELWPGYVTAIHQHENAPLLCADLTFKVLRNDSVLDLLVKYHREGGANYKDVASKNLLGQVVMTRYNNRTYRIDDLDFATCPQSKFPLRDGTQTTYIDYYFKQYQIRIRDQRQPMIVSRPRKRDVRPGQPMENIILVPELCTMTGISDEMRNDYRAMQALSNFTRAPPSNRVACIKSLLQRINTNQNIVSEMAEWNLQFSSDLLELSGRELQPEKIYGGSGVQYSYNPKTADWSREMRSTILYSACSLQKWLVIVNQRNEGLARDFLNCLSRVVQPMGITMRAPEIATIRSDRAYDYLDTLKQRHDQSLQFVMFFLPDKTKDRYDTLKKYCCIERSIASQVMTFNTIKKPQMHMSVATKVAIQVNCKLGGAAWALPIPMKNAMVIGYDSYHDSSMRGRSVGAVCCSLDKDFTRYHSKTTFQTSHEELVSGLFANIMSGLRRYKELNNQLPEKIFIYRDGVGEGQLSQIYNFELQQVLEGLKSLGDYYKPSVSFIVVTKRINTRLFLKNNRDFNNPNPGTVVDTQITRPEWYDFFLVSQCVRQGTVTPTHYNVIYDTIGLSPDIMQKLTYRLTHLYYNWPGTLRVPAPCMYAHKLAFLTGQSLHTTPHHELADVLYYL